jgi:hypothetical protein
MSKRELNGTLLTILLSPATSGIGRFEARLDGDDRVLCVSRTPFFDAAHFMVQPDPCWPGGGQGRRHKSFGCLANHLGVCHLANNFETENGQRIGGRSAVARCGVV